MPELKVLSYLYHKLRDLALTMNLTITPFLPCKDFFGLDPLAGALKSNKQSKNSLSLQEVAYYQEEQLLEDEFIRLGHDEQLSTKILQAKVATQLFIIQAFRFSAMTRIQIGYIKFLIRGFNKITDQQTEADPRVVNFSQKNFQNKFNSTVLSLAELQKRGGFSAE
ncbi:MAG: hypothetical protein EZS28_005482 [Streblomastix strix]|uniref:Uncharacterized protein n=1 Tax=Streblomastix strix TaxID=222440 RepID=A0A5J4WWS2_9EUKA|nr:MAG: hypothetical protein EZS28_005482 [Streblomastix strix]